MKVVSRRMFGVFLPGDRDFPSGGFAGHVHAAEMLVTANKVARDVDATIEPVDVLLVRDAEPPFAHNETIEPAVLQVVVALLQGHTIAELLGRSS